MANFEAIVWQSTSVSKAASFHKISEHAGNSVAVQTTTTKGKSGSGSDWFSSDSGSSSSGDDTGTDDSTGQEIGSEASVKTTTSSATVIECELTCWYQGRYTFSGVDPCALRDNELESDYRVVQIAVSSMTFLLVPWLAGQSTRSSVSIVC